MKFVKPPTHFCPVLRSDLKGEYGIYPFVVEEDKDLVYRYDWWGNFTTSAVEKKTVLKLYSEIPPDKIVLAHYNNDGQQTYNYYFGEKNDENSH